MLSHTILITIVISSITITMITSIIIITTTILLSIATINTIITTTSSAAPRVPAPALSPPCPTSAQQEGCQCDTGFVLSGTDGVPPVQCGLSMGAGTCQASGHSHLQWEDC
ncbi:hypothetical protein J1605_004228 [Eschrichtius robustus]|uniref:Uncharacterized protein n=1 Tax=Eschrichtius robustus TaxID=9764 RepID=A0AB34HH31_ESCRO|nr:hypothetical protein J1605_004228 [Eschrichtius robustus]